jgi:hypothetical protein
MNKYVNDKGHVIYATEKAFNVIYKEQGYKEEATKKVNEKTKEKNTPKKEGE